MENPGRIENRILSLVVGYTRLVYYCILHVLDEWRYKICGNRIFLLEDEESVENEVVVVTGGNRGIGKANVYSFAKRNAIVIVGCRDTATGQQTIDEIKELTGNNNLHLLKLDLTSMESVEAFATSICRNWPKVKILINNAGVAKAKWELTKEGFNPVMASNYLGHFLLTNLLLENLKRSNSPRIVVTSSTFQLLSDLELCDLTNLDVGFAEERPYVNSKCANSLFAKELAERTKKDGVTVYSYCPGLVNTDMHSQAPYLVKWGMDNIFGKVCGFSTEQASEEFVMPLALGKRHKNSLPSGAMVRFNEYVEEINAKLERNSEFSRKLWSVSEDLVHLKFRQLRNN